MRANFYLRHGARRRRRGVSGFSLVELVAVIVIVGIVSAVIVVKAVPQAGASTLGYQAQSIANDLRHTQMLAIGWGKALTFTPASSSYSVTCVAASGGPCTSTSTPVTDPGRDGTFTVTLQNGVTITGSPLQFDILGKPSAAQTFTVNADGATAYTITVAAETGFVSVQ